MSKATLSIWLVMATLLAGADGPRHSPQDASIPNRALAFGDSITDGGYSTDPYPSQLEEGLDLRVAPWEVINAGLPGEATYGGSERITGEVSTYLPQYVLILEGTNDVTREKLPSDVYNNLVTMIDNARVTAGVSGVQVMLATIIPRLDYLNDATAAMNEQAVIPAAQARGVPLCDLWTAFISRPYWPALYLDDVHPNTAGLTFIASTFYGCLLDAYPEIAEETTPPEAWMESVPASTECGQSILATWQGTDNLSWVTTYDLQTQIGSNEWQDWLQKTPLTRGLFTPLGARYGQAVGFRVRGRDLVGNLGEYSTPAYSLIADSVAPYEVHVEPLPELLLAPFTVRWWGQDACADLTTYEVQYTVGSTGTWLEWLPATPDTAGSFDPAPPQFGQTYSFRMRAQDQAGNLSAWSEPGEAFTILCAGLGGRVQNLRGQPVVGAQVEVNPIAQRVAALPLGRFVAYLASTGSYDLSVGRPDLYGPLPAMQGVVVDDDILDLQFVLPALDEAVIDGGFEASTAAVLRASGVLEAWELGGTLPPHISSQAHTGLASAELGGPGGWSLLRQAVTPPVEATNLTLSFLARLAEPGAPASLQLFISGGSLPTWTISHTIAVEDAAWSHTWYDMATSGGMGDIAASPLAASPLGLTLTFVVSDGPAILVDEIGLGSAVVGGYGLYLPVVYRTL
jgi:lysophospholipase L1-like esterase